MSDYPSAADMHVAYADNINKCESDSDLGSLSWKLQASVDSVVEWAESKELSIPPGKFQVMLFSPWNKQYHTHPEVKIHGVDVPLNQFLKFLGVTFDPLLTFNYYILDIYSKACQRLNIMHAVSGSSWGHHKETLLLN
jgi:hypothetical protein